MLGIIDDELSNKIKSQLNINIEDFGINLISNDILHIIKQHGNKNEINKCQLKINNENIMKIIETMLNPDKIQFGSKLNSMKFIKKVSKNRTFAIIMISNNKSKTLTLKTGYIKQN